MTETDPEVVWCDVEAAARILGVSGRSIRRACERGQVRTWRRVGFGIRRTRKYQVTLDEVRSLCDAGAFHDSHLDNSDKLDNSDTG